MTGSAGPIALVTGGARRIGRALVETLAERGYRVALHFHDSETAAAEVIATCSGKGLMVQPFRANLADTEQVESLLPQVLEHLGPPSLLVHNASLFEPGTLRETDAALLGRHIAVNLAAPVLLTAAYARLCLSGHVVSILDTSVTSNSTHHFAYLLSKKALADFTAMAARELAPSFRVNGIAPGYILPPAGSSPDHPFKAARKVPLQRIGAPNDIAAALLYLETATFVTGQVLTVDGGEAL